MLRGISMKGWLVIAGCILGIVIFIGIIWAIGTYG